MVTTKHNVYAGTDVIIPIKILQSKYWKIRWFGIEPLHVVAN
jgi:hypothetical protein